MIIWLSIQVVYKKVHNHHTIVRVNFQVFECMYKVIKLTAFITKNSLFVRVKSV